MCRFCSLNGCDAGAYKDGISARSHGATVFSFFARLPRMHTKDCTAGVAVARRTRAALKAARPSLKYVARCWKHGAHRGCKCVGAPPATSASTKFRDYPTDGRWEEEHAVLCGRLHHHHLCAMAFVATMAAVQKNAKALAARAHFTAVLFLLLLKTCATCTAGVSTASTHQDAANMCKEGQSKQYAARTRVEEELNPSALDSAVQ